MESILSLKDVRQRYNRKKETLKGISLDVPKGSVFGILGPNGAGKTTLLECVEGLRKIESGEIHVAGLDIKTNAKKIKKMIGIQLQSTGFFDHLNVKEIFQLFGHFYDIDVPDKEIMDFLSKIDMTEKAMAYVKHLSGGQKQKIAIGLGLVNHPKILFLDEPTTGLDPQARREIWAIIESLKKTGTTIILTTHYMEEAQELCDWIAFINDGKIYDVDTPYNLIKKSNISSRIQLKKEKWFNIELLEGIPNVTTVTETAEKFILLTNDEFISMQHLYNLAHERKETISEVWIHQTNLEDVFIKFTGRELK